MPELFRPLAGLALVHLPITLNYDDISRNKLEWNNPKADLTGSKEECIFAKYVYRKTLIHYLNRNLYRVKITSGKESLFYFNYLFTFLVCVGLFRSCSMFRAISQCSRLAVLSALKTIPACITCKNDNLVLHCYTDDKVCRYTKRE